MWVHMSPFAITALHWGWDKIHDLCFTCKDTTQLWNPDPSPNPNPNPDPNPNPNPAPTPTPTRTPTPNQDTTQLWKPLTTKTVVVHIKGHQACVSTSAP